MRILMVTQFYSPTIGGQERVVEDLSRELIARGHHVAVAALQQGGLPRVSDVSGVRVHRIESTSSRFFPGYVDPTRPHAPPAVDPKAAAELRRVIRLEKPDVVHGHDWLIHSFLPLKRPHGPGLLVTLHDQSLVCANKRLIRNGEACSGPGPAKCLRCSASHYGLPKGPAITVGNWVMSALERGLVDMFLPVSQAVADAARLADRGTPHRVIPNFVPTVAIDGIQEETVSGLPSEFILFVGDVARDKGVGVLLEAHKLLEDPPPLVLIGRIIDPDVLTPAVGARISSASLLAAPIGKVRAVGPQPHEAVLDALKRCTVTVVPSLMPEAFGLVALEAMSASRPVIASDIGGLPDIIHDDEDGILVEPGDVEALRAALARILADSALRARLRVAAKRRAAEFAAEVVVPQVEQAYEQVLSVRQGTDGQPRPSPLSDLSFARAWRSRSRLRPSRPAIAAVSNRTWRGLQRREPLVVLALAALGVAGATLLGGSWTPLRAILVLPLALVLPGYALTMAIFRRRLLGLPERIALALSLSFVATTGMSLFLYAVSIGLTLHSWTAALGVVTAAATVTACARVAPARSRPTPFRHRIALQPLLRPLPIAIVIAAVGLVAAAVVLARTPLPSPSAPGYTALWLTRKPHSGALTVGVRSEEHRRTGYRLRLVLAGRVTSQRLALAPGETWQRTLPPVRRAAASLYRAGKPGVYRSVRFAQPSQGGR